jgi:hypothetical protein
MATATNCAAELGVRGFGWSIADEQDERARLKDFPLCGRKQALQAFKRVGGWVKGGEGDALTAVSTHVAPDLVCGNIIRSFV